MTAEYELRPVRETDADALLAVYADGRALELAAVPWSDEQKGEFLRFQFGAQIAHYEREYPAAEHHAITVSGRVVGRLYVERGLEEIRILDLCLLLAQRGRGIGAAIVRSLQREGAATGRTISVHVEPWQPSIGILEHLGFERIRADDLSVFMVWTPTAP